MKTKQEKLSVKVIAVAEDLARKRFVAVLRFRDLDYQYRNLECLLSELADVRTLRNMLTDKGCLFSANTDRDEEKLKNLSSQTKTAAKWVYPATLGWNFDDKIFVHPRFVHGDAPIGKRVVAPANSMKLGPAPDALHESWVKGVAVPAARSSRMVFAICAALAAPLLKFSKQHSFGILLYGPTKIGKTTVLLSAASVVGFSREDELPNFRSTDTALAEFPFSFNDSFLPINELGLLEGDSRKKATTLNAFAYALAEGTAKTYSRHAPVDRTMSDQKWHTIALATGEDSTDQIFEAAGQTRAAGSAIRWIDLPALRNGSEDIFDNWNSKEAKLSRKDWVRRQCEIIRENCEKHNGVALQHYVAKVATNRSLITKKVRTETNRFVRKVVKDHDGPAAMHLAACFGHVAAAGILASKYGTVPWSKKKVLRSVRRCYHDARRALRTEEDLLRNSIRILKARLRGKTMINLSAKKGVPARKWKKIEGYLNKTDIGLTVTIRGESFKSWFNDQRQPAIVLRHLRLKGALQCKGQPRSKLATSIGWAESQNGWPNGSRPRSIVLKIPTNLNLL